MSKTKYYQFVFYTGNKKMGEKRNEVFVVADNLVVAASKFSKAFPKANLDSIFVDQEKDLPLVIE